MSRETYARDMDDIDQSRFDNQYILTLTAPEAAELLGVRRATLYSYVSRGLLTALPGDDPRRRSKRYLRDEVERLRRRARARSGHGPVAAGAMGWGEPVVDTAITAIEPDGPRYRGRSAVALASAGVAFEEVRDLLWQGPAGTLEPRPTAGWLSPIAPLLRADPTPATCLALGLAARASIEPARVASPDAMERRRGAGIVHALVDVLAAAADASPPPSGPVAQRLAALWSVPDAGPLDAALVLCADHELNASTFVARVAASAGADLFSCLGSALGAFSGWRHGGASARVEAFAAEVSDAASPASAVHARLRRGDAVPGCGHPLYPTGDPRARWLLDRASELVASPLALPLVAALAPLSELGHPAPNLDYGLAALASALGLPPGAPSAIFAVGRCAGWVAHVLEQRASPGLLRPRARYVGHG